MSWYLSGVTDTADKIEASLTAAAETYEAGLAGNDVQLDSAAMEAIAGAIKAAVAVVPVVAPDQEVTVTLSGHANPGHMPTAGWANDTVTITVSNTAKLPPVVAE